MAAPKKRTQAAIKATTKKRYFNKVNTYSTAEVPATAQMVKAPAPTRAGTVATSRRREWEDTAVAQSRLSSGHLEPLVRQGGLSHAEAYKTLRSGQESAAAWMKARTGAHDPTIGPDVPNINAPHEVSPTVVPQRRWEDLHPNEQRRTLVAAAEHGVTPESAKRDYGSQLDQAHSRAWRHGAADPYSSRFYAGQSEPHDRISRSATENTALAKDTSSMKVGMRDVQSIANAITSPRNYFDRKTAQGERVFPNDEHANTAIRHVLENPHMSAQEAHDTVPNNTGPAGGGIHGNIRRAAFASHQLIRGGATPQALVNPSTGNPTFGGRGQQKTTAYAGAWMHPEDADAFLVTDVHTGHGFAAHLGTKKTVGATENKKSPVEDYVDKVPNVHAFHDHIARQVHAERGLSPSVDNARYLHRGQAAQWGEERIARPDLGDATDALYKEHKPPLLRGDSIGYTPHTAGHDLAAVHVAAASAPAEEDQSWGMGDQMRHENTVAKRRRQGKLPVDPEARAAGW